MTETVQQVVVLVGGRGTRLGEMTQALPKPLLPIDEGRPFLDYLIEMIERHGYTDIILLAGYLGDIVTARYDGKCVGGARIRVVVEPQPLGTAGALTVVHDLLDPLFLMMNGDALFDINLRALEKTAHAIGALATLALREVPDSSRYGSVIEQDGRITAFREKDLASAGPGVINGGIYVLRREILDLITRLPCSIEQGIFPVLVERGEIAGERFSGYFLDVGLPETLAQGHSELPATRHRPAAFLDRDGVINIDGGYTHKPEDLAFLPGVAAAIRRLNNLGYYVLVVTNQAGVARGLYGVEDVLRFNAEIQRRLAIEGAHVDRFYIAPYHPGGTVPEFAIEHEDRKPNPGMLLKAMAEWPVIAQNSFLIGDKDSDVEAARRAGVRGYLFPGGDLDLFLDDVLRQTDGVTAPQL